MRVTVFERDATAIRGEGAYRGPIQARRAARLGAVLARAHAPPTEQIQSNALAALQAVDADTAHAVMQLGCVTARRCVLARVVWLTRPQGDRINGLVDGVSGQWYCKFDTFHPAVSHKLPVTRVISRVTLQGVLGAGLEPYIRNNTLVEGFEEGPHGVTALLAGGERVEGDVLVGADGIRSRVRVQLIGDSAPAYSNYTCYTGIADFIPPDVDTVGYRVFLGNKQYFVSSDVGGGKQQWYAFHCEPAGGSDPPEGRKERLSTIFGHWCDDVVDLIANTPEEAVLRRDIYDRPPIMTWSRGRVTLLGDSAHAMQPNLGQGGCMAIEDAYALAGELSSCVEAQPGGAGAPDGGKLAEALQRYESKRRLRVGTIHGMARMAAEMASTYKAYLGEGLGPLSFISRLHIPHPGSASGKLVMQFAMPFVLDWVLGGNSDIVQAVHVREDAGSTAPRLAGGMSEESFATYLTDDNALLRAADADWLLVPLPAGGGPAAAGATPIELSACVASPDGSITLGREEGARMAGASELVSRRHATISRDPSTGDYFVVDCGSTNGTWLNRGRLRAGGKARLVPGDELWLGARGKDGVRLRVKLRKRVTDAERAINATISFAT